MDAAAIQALTTAIQGLASTEKKSINTKDLKPKSISSCFMPTIPGLLSL
jgi:hypothetical protein